ncbi:MAG TPA: ATP-binding protein [Ktedonobacteraceae bacterium]|jgi:two-component sensor histidine kinase|nr:ATP-binding protein [Ktedonobacteraceae bacterium]
MALTNMLQPAYLLQTGVLALSIFNLVAFLWLAFTVWLNGDRKAGIARLGVCGLGLSAFFFYLHALLISTPLTKNVSGLVSQDDLWHLIWIPALGVPYIWFAIGLYYAALINSKWRKRRPWLLICAGVPGCLIFLLLLFNQSTFSYARTLQLLTDSDALNDVSSSFLSSPVLLSLLFLCYVTFCAIAPWFTLGRMARLLRVLWHFLRGKGLKTSSLRSALVDAFWDDPGDKELLEEPHLSWYLARPWLLLAALLMVGLTTTLGVLVVQAILNWVHHPHTVLEKLPPVVVSTTNINTFPLNLIVLDLIANGAVALVILLIGYSIVRHGILIERSLARRGFFEQWRGIVIVATCVASFIALLVAYTHSNLGGLLLITSLATAAYALFTWSSYTAHDRYIALLGPFVRSTSIRHWLNTDLQKTEQDLETLFYHLCHNVLAVQCAYLAVVAGPLRRSFSYRWPEEAIPGTNFMPRPLNRRKRAMDAMNWPVHGDSEAEVPLRIQVTLYGRPTICWLLPIYDERGLVATLYLGPREDGGAFTDEDMNLAHACGQRILDTLVDHEAMQAVAGLLRRRIIDVKLLGAQQRRILHDEILPQMHLALLRLETLRSLPEIQQQTSERAPKAVSTLSPSTLTTPALNEAIALITDAHRRLAAMMRSTAPGAPYRLERDGLMQAIHTMLEQDFRQAFDEVEWCVSDETATYIDDATPPAIAELVFAAVQEALRNAARHARGIDVHRHLHVTFKATRNIEDGNIEFVVADDGVGITSATSTTTGTGGGLLTHSALLAIAGGSLTFKSEPDEGVTVRIVVPATL